MIRAATELDAQAIADIYNHYIQNTVITFEELPVSQNDIIERIQKVNGSNLPWLVAVDHGIVIGYAYAGKWNVRSAYRHTVETAVYLSNSSLSKGWGTSFIRRSSTRYDISQSILSLAASLFQIRQV